MRKPALAAFENISSLSKNIRNEETILEGHKQALAVLEAARPYVAFISQLTMRSAIEKSEKWLAELKRNSEQEAGCATWHRCTRCNSHGCSLRAFYSL